MTSTDTTILARHTVEAAISELDPHLMRNTFDDAVGKIAQQFEYQTVSAIDQSEFHGIISDFVGRIYGQALNALWMALDPTAEAISLLENHYQSAVYGTGYTAALLDANDPEQGGIQAVLMGLAEAIVAVERQKHIRAIFAVHLSGLDWEVRREIARLLIEDYGRFLPESLAGCSPAQLMGEIPTLLHAHIHTNSTLEQITAI